MHPDQGVSSHDDETRESQPNQQPDPIQQGNGQAKLGGQHHDPERNRAYETTLSVPLVDLGELNAIIQRTEACLEVATDRKANAQKSVYQVRSRITALEDIFTPGMRRHTDSLLASSPSSFSQACQDSTGNQAASGHDDTIGAAQDGESNLATLGARNPFRDPHSTVMAQLHDGVIRTILVTVGD